MSNFMNDFALNNNKSTLKSMTFNYNYLDDKDNGYRIYVTSDDDAHSLRQNIMIISAFGFVNPRFKVDEIYTNISKLTKLLNMDMSNLFIFLDLLELTGIQEKHLFNWVFIEQDGKVSDSINEILHYDISSEKNRVICDYEYIMKSLIYNSQLNSKKMIDIMAFALRERCNDDISLEHMVKNFKLSLKRLQNEKKIEKENYNKSQIL